MNFENYNDVADEPLKAFEEIADLKSKLAEVTETAAGIKFQWEQAQGELADSQAQVKFFDETHKANDLILKQTEARVASLVAAYKKYGQHKPKCGFLPGSNHCWCGFFQVTQALAQEPASLYEHDIETIESGSDKIKSIKYCKRCADQWFADDYPERTHDCIIPPLPENGGV